MLNGTSGSQFGAQENEVFDNVYESSESIPKIKPNSSGYIYACLLGDKVKIGIARDPQKRIFQLECGCGEYFEKMYVSGETSEPKEDERLVHDYFRLNRGIGEWFYAPFDIVVLAIRSLDDLDDLTYEGEYPFFGTRKEGHEQRRAKLRRETTEKECEAIRKENAVRYSRSKKRRK